MRRVSLRTAVLMIGAALLAQPALGLVIDDFEEGSFALVDVSATAGSAREEQSVVGGHIIGGVRLVEVDGGPASPSDPGVESSALFAPAPEIDDGAQLTAATNGQVAFIYDGVVGGAQASGSSGALALDLTSFSALRFGISMVAVPEFPLQVKLRLTLYDSDSSAALAVFVPPTGTVSVPLDWFASNPFFDLDDVRQIEARFSSNNAIEDSYALRLSEITAVSGPGSVLHVDASGTCGGAAPCYATIQAAIDASSAQDVVRVHPGSYVERVRILGKSDLVVEGDPASPAGSAVIQPPDEPDLAECLLGAAAVEVGSASDVTLRRLAVAGYTGHGVRLRGGAEASSGVEILGLRVAGNGHADCGAGILVEAGNAETLLAHNAVHANARDGIAFAGGLSLETAVPQHLWSNTVYGNGRHGIPCPRSFRSRCP